LTTDEPIGAVSEIYDDWEDAQDAELKLLDDALKRLQKAGKNGFSRSVFDGITDWKRGKVSRAYAEGRVVGTADEDDDD
jgi:hypothetical protein